MSPPGRRVEALKRHKVELLGWRFPGALNDEAKVALNSPSVTA